MFIAGKIWEKHTVPFQSAASTSRLHLINSSKENNGAKNIDLYLVYIINFLNFNYILLIFILNFINTIIIKMYSNKLAHMHKN